MKICFEIEVKVNLEIVCLKRYIVDLVCSMCDIVVFYEVDVIIEGICWIC